MILKENLNFPHIFVFSQLSGFPFPRFKNEINPNQI